MHDGRCVTTGTLVERNEAQSSPVRATLQRDYGCTDTVFLRPLPGGVIEHVDMFMLRAGSTVLLATYDPSRPDIREQLRDASEAMRALVIEATAAMDENYRRLKALNYEVVRVPSPLPKIVDNDVYYPTILNGLVWVSAQNQANLILPKYDGYQNDIQEAGVKIIKNAYSWAHVSQVEATASAKLQGAIHCLTLVAPYAQSWFKDEERAGTYARIAANVRGIERAQIAKLLTGTWSGENIPISLQITASNIVVTVANRQKHTWSIDNINVTRGSREVRVTVREHGHQQVVVFNCMNPERVTVRLPVTDQNSLEEISIKRSR